MKEGIGPLPIGRAIRGGPDRGPYGAQTSFRRRTGHVAALKPVEQELSEAAAIVEKEAVGKSVSGGLVKEIDQIKFVVVVLSDDRVKEVFLSRNLMTERDVLHSCA